MSRKFDMGWVAEILERGFGRSLRGQFEQPEFPSMSQFIICREGTKDPSFVLHCEEKTNIKAIAKSLYDLMKESNLDMGPPNNEENIPCLTAGYIHFHTPRKDHEATVSWTDKLQEIRVSITKNKVDNIRTDSRYPHKYIRKVEAANV